MTNVFVVHGMGTHSEDWWDSELEKVNKVKRYDALASTEGKTLKSFTEKLNFIELNYSILHDKIRDAVASESKFTDLIKEEEEAENAKFHPDAIAKWKTDWANTAQEVSLFYENDFLKDSVWNVFLVASKLTRHYTAVHVARQILDAFTQIGNAGINWSVLAHSLGTAVIQDALNLLNDHIKAEGTNYIEAAETVALLCNFSRTAIGDQTLVTRHPFKDQTSVWPSSYGEGSIARHYVSLRHKLDPLSYLANKMPAPQNWQITANDFSRDKCLILDHSELYHLPNEIDDEITDFGGKMHGIANYLSHPRVHLRVFPRMLMQVGRYEQETSVQDSSAKFLEDRKKSVSANALKDLVGGDWGGAAKILFANFVA